MRLKIIATPLQPPQRHLHRRLRSRAFRRMLGTLVERHNDVGPQPDLCRNRALRRKHVRRAIQVRPKRHAVFRHLAQLAQAEHLEPARVGQNWLVPRHEALHPAQRAHHLHARTQVQVVGIVQQNLDTQLFKHILRHALYRPQRANRHKHRRLHHAVRRKHMPCPRLAVGGLDLKAKGHEQ